MKLFGRKTPAPDSVVREPVRETEASTEPVATVSESVAPLTTPLATPQPTPQLTVVDGDGPADAAASEPDPAAAQNMTSGETAAEKLAARLAFLDKGTSMTSIPPKPPISSMSGGMSRGDALPRRMHDMPGSGMGSNTTSSLIPRRGEFGSDSTSSDSPPGLQQRRLTVGRDILLTGEIASCDVLVVEGTVDARLRDGRNIEVTEAGLFKGSVEIDDADIAGRFEGDLLVRNRLRVRATGRIIGTVVYGELEVESGGQISGSMSLFDANAKPAEQQITEPVNVNTTWS